MTFAQCSKCGLVSPVLESNAVWITNETHIYLCDSCVEKAKHLNTSEVKD